MSDSIILHAGEYVISAPSVTTRAALEALQRINGEKP